MKQLVFLFCLFAALPVAAQPRLDLRLLVPNSPDYYYYQLYFAAYCGESPIYDLEKRQLILKEYLGLIDSSKYILDRIPSADADNCYDIALLIDNSSSISVPTLSRVSDAGKAFIDSMGRECQSASIISFADHPIVHTFLGNDRDLSKQAFDEMKPGGKRVLYDALYAGMVELETNGRQGQATVVALTTGADNGSTITEEELLSKARRWRIRLFLFALGSPSVDSGLATLCRETGGLYFSIPNEDTLTAMFTAFEGFVQRSFDEYRLVRQTKNPDMREVTIRMRLEACNDSVWVERVFRFGDLVDIEAEPAPVSLMLGHGYPDPVSANQELQIPFAVDSRAARRGVSLRIFDVLGREKATVIEGDIAPGRHIARFSPSAFPPGVYVFRLSSGGEMRSGKFQVVR